MPRKPLPTPTPPDCRDTLGLSPSALAKREFHKAAVWFPNPPYPEFDRYSNPQSPKTIYYNDVTRAAEILKKYIPVTPLLKAKSSKKLDMFLYFKVETRHTTGSFHERSALYTLLKLTADQCKGGVFTASIGNWAMALAHQGRLLNVHVTIVVPEFTSPIIVSTCQDYGATVVVHGKNIDEAKTHAFKILADQGRVGTYLNGFDHPNVIAAEGCIGAEIMNQLPETDAILVPVGGGGLIAGIASIVKHIKPNVLIYGVEPGKSCSFAKALDNERPYRTVPEKSLAYSLTVPKSGENAFHTARSLIDKLPRRDCQNIKKPGTPPYKKFSKKQLEPSLAPLSTAILVHDDWTARAILHLLEEECIIAEGAGAISLGALLCIPNILPELRGKKVVCVVSGGNIDLWHLKRTIIHGKAAEGRIFTMTIRVAPGEEYKRTKILKVMKYLQCSVLSCQTEQTWMDEDNNLRDTSITVICESKSYKETLTLRNVVDRYFPNNCEFTSDTFKPRNKCVCFPRK